MTPRVDLLVIVYNCRSLLPTFVASLRTISTPITAYFLDNGSLDGTPDALAAAIQDLPFRAYLLRSLRNNGFARGMNLLSRQGRGEFLFLLNPDAELMPNCLENLLARADSDPGIAICEAKQTPREHPKAVDSRTGETTWCSGAAALIRREAFEQVNGFDERLYFMYCEDVDLSWKLWIRGWKCIYVPEAVVRHLTQDLLAGKRRTRENYFSFRNSLFFFTGSVPGRSEGSCGIFCSKGSSRGHTHFEAKYCSYLLYWTIFDIFRISLKPGRFGGMTGIPGYV